MPRRVEQNMLSCDGSACHCGDSCLSGLLVNPQGTMIFFTGLPRWELGVDVGGQSVQQGKHERSMCRRQCSTSA